ncbi:MAG: serine protease [Sulfitobacter sp.]
MTLTADQLRKVITQHEPVVDLALEQLFTEPDMPVKLDALRMLTQDDQDVADVLAKVIIQGGLSRSLETFLGARGISLVDRDQDEVLDQNAAAFAGAEIAEPDPKDFEWDKLGPFATRAAAFRCRIKVDDAIEGSGAFVSKRLVLTAAHVIDKVIVAIESAQTAGADEANLPKITVKASDGKEYLARCIWYSPVHEDERNGIDPPETAANTHKDVALLRVGLPIGLNYGFCQLPSVAVKWTGSRLMTLVHYPDGVVRGMTTGRVQRDTLTDRRLNHTIDTMGGSSGGLAFDRDLKFIGIHQGRWNAFRRLVPHSSFDAVPGFANAINDDQPRRYLWSLEDDVNGQIVIGRQNFFAGLAHMLEEPNSQMRGIWIRRRTFDQTTGLSFGFEMLRGFLKNRILPTDVINKHATFLIATDLNERDLTATLALEVLGTAAVAARPGVRAGETSDVAQERDRAMRLAQDLQDRAAQSGRTYWLFFEPPPDNKLSDTARTQFEHLMEWLITHPNLRVILAGFEQYAIEPLKFETIGEVPAGRKPGLLVDMIGQFTDADVRVTLSAMLSDLSQEENTAPAVLDDLVRRVTRDMSGDRPSHYSFVELDRAVTRIRRFVKAFAEID